MRLRRMVAACLGAAMALTGVLASTAQAQTNGPLDYVALGDSYSSGVGAPNTTGTCFRSPQGYPKLWADSHNVSSFTDVTCGGAVTTDVIEKQVSALNAGTDLVTVTIGGNDAGFASTLLICTFGTTSTCKRTVEEGLRDNTLAGKLDRAYAAIRAAAPNARVIVLGYPRLYEDTLLCTTMSRDKRRILNDGADQLTALIRGRAVAAGFEFLDVRPFFAGHGVCASDEWINSSLLAGIGVYHPNAKGYRNGYLVALNSVTG